MNRVILINKYFIANNEHFYLSTCAENNYLIVDKDDINLVEQGTKISIAGPSVSHIQVVNTARNKVALLNLQKDKFGNNFATLQKPFSFQIIKPILDALKLQYPDVTVYCDCKKVYTKSIKEVESVYLSIYYNKDKKTINVKLSA